MSLAAGRATSLLLLLVLAVAVAVAAAGTATGPAPAPAVDCVSAVSGLIDCLDYLTPGTNSTNPPSTCCAETKTAVGEPSTVDCLCGFMASKQLPIPINMTRVFALPAACGQSAAVFSKCHAPSPSARGSSSSGGATAPPQKAAAAARFPVTTNLLVAAPLLSFFYL